MMIPEKKVITKKQIIEDLEKINVKKGDLLNIKASVKSIGHVEGGPKTVIQALLDAVGPKGTIVSDSFINVYPLPFSKEHAKIISSRFTPSYAGAIANCMINHPNSFRSTHPVQRYAAIGALAQDLCKNHTPASGPYDLLEEMTNMGGKNLKIGPDSMVPGVGTTHIVIEKLGLKRAVKPSGIMYIDNQGKQKLFRVDWSGGCGFGFNTLLPWYQEAKAVLGESTIGLAPCRLTLMKTTYDKELELLKKDPRVILCDNPLCAKCRLSWPFSDKKYLTYYYHKIINYLKRYSNGS